jgi:hypothetical protein
VSAAGGLSGVDEGDMSGRDGSESMEPLVGRRGVVPRDGPRIGRWAVKLRGVGEWGGWGWISDEGLGQQNPGRSEGPWGSAGNRTHGGA